MPEIEEIIDNFSVLDDYRDDRYRYVIELGRELAPLTAATPRHQQGARMRKPS